MDHLYLISTKYGQICHIFAFIGAFLDFYRKQSEGQKSVHRSRAWEEKWYILKNIYLCLNKSLISQCTGPAAVSSNFPYSSFHVLSVCVILLCFYLEKFYHIYYNWSCKIQIQVSKVLTYSWLPVITIEDFTIYIFTLDFFMLPVALIALKT